MSSYFDEIPAITSFPFVTYASRLMPNKNVVPGVTTAELLLPTNDAASAVQLLVFVYERTSCVPNDANAFGL